VPALAEALADADDGVRLKVAMALESTGPGAAPAVPALARAVRDRDGNVRLWAAKALTRIGPAAREALPALEQASRYDSTRPAAEEAIRAIKGSVP
jgi:HEAT repeat protein